MSKDEQAHTDKHEKPGAPKWALRGAQTFIEQQKIADEVLDLCIRGIRVITGMPLAIKAMASAEGTDGHADSRLQLEHAEKLSSLANREIESGFYLLLSQGTVSLWNSLENMTKTTIRNWLCNSPEILTHDPWSTLKVRVGDYAGLDVEQRADYLVELLEQTQAAHLKLGVGRFETMFDSIGLGGGVDDSVRRSLIELQQIRHILVHRNGVCDRRIMNACPWLELTAGKQVPVRNDMYKSYSEAAFKYVLEIIVRVGEHFGVPEMRSMYIVT